jgi:ribosomal protein L40E
MKGLPRRIPFRRRTSDPVPPETQPTIVAPAQAPPPSEPLPAGLAPEDVAPSRPSFRDRGRLRRRLRYLRRVRELGFRDLGGLVFDLHRFARRNDELVLGKLAALDAVDRELRAIERVLDERRDIIELREPGVAACPRCGALHGSDARFCPQCGTQASGPLAMIEVGATTPPVPAPPLEGSSVPAPPTPPPVAPEPGTEPLSAADLGATPVSGALAGAPAAAPDDQPTRAMPAVSPRHEGAPVAGADTDADSTGNGTSPPADDPGSATVTGGDPLAPRERPDA